MSNKIHLLTNVVLHSVNIYASVYQQMCIYLILVTTINSVRSHHLDNDLKLMLENVASDSMR